MKPLEEAIRDITYKATSDMLDNPYGNGLYPTSEFYERMDREIASLFTERLEAFAEDLKEQCEDSIDYAVQPRHIEETLTRHLRKGENE